MSTPLLTGVVELIWNAIDADAQNVQIRLRENSLGGIAEIELVDDGHGIDLQTAHEGFLTLGLSWKAGGARSKTLNRPLHGKAGEGRFKLFRNGGFARWESVSELGGERRRLQIVIESGEREVAIDDLGATDDPVGTRVLLSGFVKSPQRMTGQAALDRLLTNFVLPIEDHQLTITYGGVTLDPGSLQEAREELAVEGGPDQSLELTVIQWKRSIGDRDDLHLCTAEGAVLERVPSYVRGPGLKFTAYLRWDGFSDHVGNLSVVDLDAGEVSDAVNAGRRRLERHFEDLLSQRQTRIITSWQSEGVYPFKGKPADEAQRATRQTFDVIALETAETVNRANKANKKLALRLLREALERNPGQVHRVLGEVLALPEDRLNDLTRLLERTRLAHIISASTSIADRLDFLHALAELTCSPELREDVLERQHLHMILEDESWVFGEEYALAVSEAGLRKVLRHHLKLLGRDDISLEPAPVRDAAGKRRRVDLMLAANVPHSRDTREHLIVELKRPNVDIGTRELEQISDYAHAVASDDRFDTKRTRWEFWAISTSLSERIDRQRRSYGPHGLAYQDPDVKVRVWVKTWAELIHDAEHRLKYVRDKLGVDPDERSALDYLQRVHSEKLPDSALDSEAA